MPINSFLYPGAKFIPSYEVANSCRFNDGDTASLSKTPSSNGSNTVWTVSMWCKRSHITTDQKLHAAGTSATYELLFSDVDQLTLYNGSTTVFVTNRVFRDVSAWLHVVVSYNTGASGTDKCKLFINGTLETSFATDNRSSAGAMNHINQSSQAQFVGNNDAGNGFDGYIAEVCVIDGTALVATSFGEFDSNSPTIWKPIDVSGLTFGTNGFYLDFEDSSNLGNDVNGGTDLTENNLAATDQSTDTCTNNFATLNPLTNTNSSYTFSEGNLIGANSGQWLASVSTIGVSAGKWYWEAKYLSNNFGLGIGKIGTTATQTSNLSSANNGYVSKYSDGYEYLKNNTANYKVNNNNDSNYGSTPSANDIMMVAFDADNGTIWVGKQGTWFGSATQSEIENGTTTNSMFSSITIDDFFVPTASLENGSLSFNFGSPPYAISSGNSDANGFGNFEYAVPSGYFALCTKNLAEFG